MNPKTYPDGEKLFVPGPPIFPACDRLGPGGLVGIGRRPEILVGESLQRGVRGALHQGLLIVEQPDKVGHEALFFLQGAGQGSRAADFRVVILKLVLQRVIGHARQALRQGRAGLGLYRTGQLRNGGGKREGVRDAAIIAQLVDQCVLPLLGCSDQFGTELVGLAVSRSQRALGFSGPVAARTFFATDLQLRNRARTLLGCRAFCRLACRPVAWPRVLSAYAPGLKLDFPRILYSAFQPRGKVRRQVRALEKQEREAGVDRLFVAASPAAAGQLPLKNEVSPPFIPVNLANGLEPIDHAHAFQSPEKVVIGLIDIAIAQPLLTGWRRPSRDGLRIASTKSGRRRPPEPDALRI